MDSVSNGRSVVAELIKQRYSALPRNKHFKQRWLRWSTWHESVVSYRSTPVKRPRLLPQRWLPPITLSRDLRIPQTLSSPVEHFCFMTALHRPSCIMTYARCSHRIEARRSFEEARESAGETFCSAGETAVTILEFICGCDLLRLLEGPKGSQQMVVFFMARSVVVGPRTLLRARSSGLA